MLPSLSIENCLLLNLSITDLFKTFWVRAWFILDERLYITPHRSCCFLLCFFWHVLDECNLWYTPERLGSAVFGRRGFGPAFLLPLGVEFERCGVFSDSKDCRRFWSSAWYAPPHSRLERLFLRASCLDFGELEPRSKSETPPAVKRSKFELKRSN